MQRMWSVYLDEPARYSPRIPTMEYSSRVSIASEWEPPSVHSRVESTRHILGTTSTAGSSTLRPPKVPFSFANRMSQIGNRLPLSLNYLPTKFSGAIVSSDGTRFRSGKQHPSTRPGFIDERKDRQARWAPKPAKLRWNKFKWILFLTNSMLTVYSLGAIVVCLLTWFDVWTHAAVVRSGNHPELVISTVAASLGVFTSVMGWAGILLNNRSFLAWYTFLSWITFAFLVSPGYITYKRHAFNLEGKINAQWSRQLGSIGRLRIQDQLLCCGYFSPFVEATVSQTCYARSILPGCKSPYLRFERSILDKWYKVIFILVPIHIVVMLAGLLCSNHITYRFGKGMMPKAYRFNMRTMAVIFESYSKHLTEHYGPEVADQIIGKTRAILHSSAYNNAR